MTEIIDFLKNYTDGKQNIEKVEISVIQLNRVIKALEQEPVLDKIRAEIDSHCSDNRDRNDGLYIAMNIIEKYKEEVRERMREIKCPYDLNQFILGDRQFENTFPKEECEQRKFYGDCYHCFSTAIASRDHQLKASVTDNIMNKIKSIVAEWKSDTWTDNLSYECMIKIAEIVDKAEGSYKE